MEFDPIPIGSCSKEHQNIYQQWFNCADSDGDGRITGNDATKFFAMSNLSCQDLKQVPLSSVTSIIDGLKRLYIQKLKPLEVTYHFNDFVSPLLTNSDFDANPLVMLLGQYSTGHGKSKTTFIKHLLKCGYPVWN
ncbi:unnamed protein product [Trifolium pratense]|uniref:Uncharacterized protein n=1 Tax=Trifolium pratense TaxID=57577 RepID=A0ACB0KA73_TRIPR|nr:unnamed protein product [Trifolium pratense]